MLPTYNEVALCVKRIRNRNNAQQQFQAVKDIVDITERAVREDIARAAEKDGYFELAKRIREGWPHV